MREPEDNDNVDCHWQNIEPGGLVCRAAKRTGGRSTNKVNRRICFSCPAGRVYREVGCDSISPSIKFSPAHSGPLVMLKNLFCEIRKKNVTMEECKNCNLVTAETTRRIVSDTRSLYQANNFYSAYQDIEEARKSMRDGKFDNVITRSLSSLESAMKICHENMDKDLPDKDTATGLWKSTRKILKFNDIEPKDEMTALVNTLFGVVTKLAGLRNALSDSHGSNNTDPVASKYIAELALNTSCTLSTIIIRRYKQIN